MVKEKMSKYRGPRLRITRRLGKLPGLTNKLSNKVNTPGQHGVNFNKKTSQYGIRLKEKQKLRYNYGISERQLLNYIKKARKKKGSSGKLLLTLLEMRLDNIVYRLGFAPTILGARQLINHGHITLNNAVVNIPSFTCQVKNSIKVKKTKASQELVKKNIENNDKILIPQHLNLNKENLEGKIVSLVNRKSISLIINELLVVEYYSRKV